MDKLIPRETVIVSWCLLAFFASGAGYIYGSYYATAIEEVTQTNLRTMETKHVKLENDLAEALQGLQFGPNRENPLGRKIDRIEIDTSHWLTDRKLVILTQSGDVIFKRALPDPGDVSTTQKQ